MIPEEKSAAVTRALGEAFGVTTFDDIRILSEGLFNKVLVFRIAVQGSAYLLRIILRSEDPTHHFTCMQAAADACLAPRIHYTNVEDKICITDFVTAAPLTASEALTHIPVALRTLHALPAFPDRAHAYNTTPMFNMHQGPALDAFLARFRAANLLPADESTQVFEWLRQLQAVHPHADADMVSSHNDMKPENVVFDGQRLWLVDWEAAFRNDRYVDLAVFANFIVTTDAEQSAYLSAYFGQPPDAYQLARYFLMQQVVHLSCAMGYLFLGSLSKPVPVVETIPEFDAMHRRIWAGEFDLRDNANKIAYSRVHWNRLARNMQQPALNEAIQIVSDRHACAKA